MKARSQGYDYAAMAEAAEEMARRSVGARREMNKALSERYRALSMRGRVPAKPREMHETQAGEV